MNSLTILSHDIAMKDTIRGSTENGKDRRRYHSEKLTPPLPPTEMQHCFSGNEVDENDIRNLIQATNAPIT